MNNNENIKNYQPLWGNWYINDLFGNGNFGEVYKLYKDFYDIKYYSILKVINVPNDFPFTQSDKFSSSYLKFLNEKFIQFLTFKNEYILSLEDFAIKKSNSHFDFLIRNELGYPLSKYLLTNKLTKDDILNIGLSLLKALKFLQTNSINHCNIKISNIFVTNNGNYKLSDFYSNLFIDNYSKLNIESLLCMSPELYNSNEKNHTTDIFSIGIILYKLLNNNLFPFESNDSNNSNHSDILKKRISSAIIPKPQNAQDLLGDIILKACSNKVEERYQSADVFIKVLEAYIVTSHQIESNNDTFSDFITTFSIDFHNPKTLKPNTTKSIETNSTYSETVIAENVNTINFSKNDTLDNDNIPPINGSETILSDINPVSNSLTNSNDNTTSENVIYEISPFNSSINNSGNETIFADINPVSNSIINSNDNTTSENVIYEISPFNSSINNSGNETIFADINPVSKPINNPKANTNNENVIDEISPFNSSINNSGNETIFADINPVSKPIINPKANTDSENILDDITPFTNTINISNINHDSENVLIDITPFTNTIDISDVKHDSKNVLNDIPTINNTSNVNTTSETILAVIPPVTNNNTNVNTYNETVLADIPPVTNNTTNINTYNETVLANISPVTNNTSNVNTYNETVLADIPSVTNNTSNANTYNETVLADIPPVTNPSNLTDKEIVTSKNKLYETDIFRNDDITIKPIQNSNIYETQTKNPYSHYMETQKFKSNKEIQKKHEIKTEVTKKPEVKTENNTGEIKINYELTNNEENLTLKPNEYNKYVNIVKDPTVRKSETLNPYLSNDTVSVPEQKFFKSSHEHINRQTLDEKIKQEKIKLDGLNQTVTFLDKSKFTKNSSPTKSAHNYNSTIKPNNNLTNNKNININFDKDNKYLYDDIKKKHPEYADGQFNFKVILFFVPVIILCIIAIIYVSFFLEAKEKKTNNITPSKTFTTKK